LWLDQHFWREKLKQIDPEGLVEKDIEKRDTTLFSLKSQMNKRKFIFVNTFLSLIKNWEEIELRDDLFFLICSVFGTDGMERMYDCTHNTISWKNISEMCNVSTVKGKIKKGVVVRLLKKENYAGVSDLIDRPEGSSVSFLFREKIEKELNFKQYSFLMDLLRDITLDKHRKGKTNAVSIFRELSRRKVEESDENARKNLEYAIQQFTGLK
jgi:hypothetical protein